MTGSLTAKDVLINQCLTCICCRVLEMTQRIDLEETEEEESVDGLLYQVNSGPLLYIFCLLKADWVSLVF